MTDPMSHPLGIVSSEEKPMAKNSSGGTWRAVPVSRSKVSSVMKKAAAREGQFVRSPSSVVRQNGSTSAAAKKR